MPVSDDNLKNESEISEKISNTIYFGTLGTIGTTAKMFSSIRKNVLELLELL